MNNEIEARPFEEYKEMIQNMSKEKMIDGLYDLSKDCIRKGKEIERLNNIINEYEKWLKAHLDEEFYWFKMYDKLQELKGDGSNE